MTAKDSKSLDLAVRSRDLARAKLLLARGASATYADEGYSVLWLAASRGAPFVKLLLDHGAAIDALTPTGQTALGHACQLGQGVVAKLLLARGADPNVCSGREASPLYHAVRANKVELVKAMLAAGARDVKSITGRHAIDHATPAIATLLTAATPKRRSSSAPRGRGAPARRRRARSAG